MKPSHRQITSVHALSQTDAELSSRSSAGKNSTTTELEHFFGCPTYLTVSGQLHLEAITGLVIYAFQICSPKFAYLQMYDIFVHQSILPPTHGLKVKRCTNSMLLSPAYEIGRGILKWRCPSVRPSVRPSVLPSVRPSVTCVFSVTSQQNFMKL